jgi:Tfp pilus assembly protein PilO
MKHVIALLIIFNVLLILLLANAWFIPMANELANLRSLAQLQENRLRIKEINLARHEANLHELTGLERIESASKIIAYERLAETIAEVSALARAHNVTERDFFTGEPTMRDDYAHIRLVMSYAGGYADVCRFIEGLADMPCYIDRLTLAPHPTEAYVWLHLSMYAAES